MNKKINTKMITEGGIILALSALLNHITIYQAVNGGSVSAGGMVPLILFALRWGMGPGFIVGASYGVLDFILKPFFYHPLQFVLDYPLAYGLLGLAGLSLLFKGKDIIQWKDIIFGSTLAIVGRMISHILSGVIFFREAAGAQNPWLYSLIYNSTYLIPELIITITILILIWKPLNKSIRF